MSVTSIKPDIKTRLWVMAGGRCEYEGCNKPLWRDDLTMAQMNRAYIGHIIANSPDGPRGDPKLSSQLASDISNLMLLCDKHHRLIDNEQVEEHTVERLQQMKKAHEFRIEISTSIQLNKKSEILLYGANIGQHSSPVSYKNAVEAMYPSRYPASYDGIILGMINSTFQDREREFWRIEAENLCRLFAERVKPRLSTRSIEHLSIFAAAPQPLLILLGTLLSDIPTAEVYQLHREPPDWKWQEHPDNFDYIVREPDDHHSTIALNLSLSATIDNSRIISMLGEEVSIWTVAIEKPNNDFLKGRLQLSMFHKCFRSLMDRIKSAHGEEALIHIFPAVPVSVAIEIGRIWMPKADLPIRVYDENKSTGGFIYALDIKNE